MNVRLIIYCFFAIAAVFTVSCAGPTWTKGTKRIDMGLSLPGLTLAAESSKSSGDRALNDQDGQTLTFKTVSANGTTTISTFELGSLDFYHDQDGYASVTIQVDVPFENDVDCTIECEDSFGSVYGKSIATLDFANPAAELHMTVVPQASGVLAPSYSGSINFSNIPAGTIRVLSLTLQNYYSINFEYQSSLSSAVLCESSGKPVALGLEDDGVSMSFTNLTGSTKTYFLIFGFEYDTFSESYFNYSVANLFS